MFWGTKPLLIIIRLHETGAQRYTFSQTFKPCERINSHGFSASVGNQSLTFGSFYFDFRFNSSKLKRKNMKKIVDTIFHKCYQNKEFDFKTRQFVTLLLLFMYGGSIIFISMNV
ncbi:MAG: hypothetical protein DCO96_09350 [Fluviicola sp. XM-24bin1]|nr:MAG: hypothetical protein DCO96_09350 [Fluviicola sp. XM-24bin1]